MFGKTMTTLLSPWNLFCGRQSLGPSRWTICFAAIGFVLAPPALAIDWNTIKGTDITLFYPGQSSWEWVLTQADHSGAKKFREGKNCRACHKGEETAIGNLIVSGKKLEPNPIAGKPGSIPVNVKAAYDDERLYVRLEWTDPPPSGVTMDAEYESKVAMMLDGGSVPEATRAGCWGVCHDDAASMASAARDKGLTKYLGVSRVKIQRSGGGENFKSKEALDQLLRSEVFMEYWQARLNKNKPAVAIDGFILERRNENRSPMVSATAEFKQRKWVVVLTRKLLTNSPGHKNIVPGKTYTVGFALHDDHTERRFHHISLEHTLVLDQGEADIMARKLAP